MTNTAMETAFGAEPEPDFQPRYNLTQEELDVLDRRMVDSVREVFPGEGVYSALISPDHPYSNFVRGHEARFFPEVTEFPAEKEDNTLLFALVDTRRESDRVVHVGTISGPGLQKHGTPELDPGSTGFLCVDELVGLGNFTAQEFKDHYEARGIDLSKSVAVETNIRVGEPVAPYRGAKTVDLGYLTLFGLIEINDPEVGKAAVFASINRASIISFGRVGIDHESLMGRDNLVTPESLVGRTSTPVAITYDEQCRALFGSMGQQLPRVTFGMDQAA